MALFHCNFYSEVLQTCVSADVILPQRRPTELQTASASPKYPTLYLLHGLLDDHTIWQRRTSIEWYVETLDLAVVMPAAGRSFYTDMAHGPRYFTFFSEELPRLMRSFFPLSERREDTFAAGLSMGGYGAFKLALTYPERYAAAASLSGALDIAVAAQGTDPTWQAEMRLIFGDTSQVAGSRHDLFSLAKQLAASGNPIPRLYQCCGTEDFLYPSNLRFRDYARSLGLDLTYEDGSGGHEWKYWDQQIQRVLAWLPPGTTVPLKKGAST
jgi:S-formylglutathione hydrolase FrmB